MKKLYYLLIVFPLVIFGQTQSENYVKTTTYRSENGGNPSVSITYFDGLGRPIQQIQNAQSGTGKNIVTPIVYDQFGRQVKEYLPYATQTNDLDFIPTSTAITNQSSFSQYSGQVSYSEKLIENSPLNRVLKQSAPGNSWAMGSGKEIKMDYQTNVATGDDAVKLYTATSSFNSSTGEFLISLVNNGSTNYPANVLYKTITKDENWTSGVNNTTEEFTDKLGKIILKRTFGESMVNGVLTNTKHETYFVYDQYGNLTYVIPPLVTDVNTQLDGLCYQYKYDHRNRMVEKKIPNKQWEYIIYDKLDRIVATGPALSPFTDAPENTYGWLVTKYDPFNRTLYTGWQSESTNFNSSLRVTRQNTITGLTTLNETKLASSSVDGIDIRYSNNVVLFSTPFKLLTVNYYDNYDFPNAPVIPASVEGQEVYYNNTTRKPKGLQTGTWTRILEAITSPIRFDRSYILFDNKSRPIRNHNSNYLGGITQVDTKYDFSKTLYTLTTHKKTASATLVTVKDALTYTDQDRVLTQTHQINGGAIQLLAKNDYDELGQLITKYVGGTDLTGLNPLQKVDYTYNIRGWLTGINDIDNLDQGTYQRDLFSFKINYDQVQGNVAGVEPLFNGNIAETYWRTSSDNKLRKYGYQYDDLNRLVNATYQKPETTLPIPNSYKEALWYDKNGNITHLFRNGGLDSESNYVDALQIDDLDYAYTNNQLQSVSDATGSPQGFKDGASNQIEYHYDLNGNMDRDDNKGIVSIKYNHLNLPTEIVFTGNVSKINYLYDAVGQKVKKTVSVNSTTTFTTDYLDGFQYFGDVLNFFSHSEGYVKNTVVNGVNNYNYVFNYTDHLGNIRLSYGLNSSNVLTIIEENHYYPFGLKHSSYNTEQYNYAKMANNTVNLSKAAPVDPNIINDAPFRNYDYKFESKEWQDDLGLNFYDFGARNYDPAIVRTLTLDPLAEKFTNISPYSFLNNNPLYFIDPTGMSVEPPIGFDTKDGTVHKDDDGSWIYNKDSNTWVGQDGSADIENRIMLNEVVMKKVDPNAGTYFARGNRGSGIYGWNDGSAERFWNKNMPITSSVYSFYNGAKNGDGSEMAWGAGFLFLDIATFGEGSVLLRGGKTFAQFKLARGGTQTLAKISTSTGVQRISTEFHHVFLTQRMQRAYGLPNWMVNNSLNVWKLNTVQHSLIDPYRYNFLRAGFKTEVGWFGKYNWFTKF